MHTWFYRGPVYRFGKTLSYLETVETIIAATQIGAAQCANRELCRRLKVQSCEIDPRFLKRTGQVAPKPVCPNCGTVLTDGGFCPMCDDNCDEE